MGRLGTVVALCLVMAAALALAPAAPAATSPAKASTPVRPPLVTVDFVSASSGWAAGADRILRTRDGGATWRVSRLAGNVQVGAIGFWNRSAGCAVGSDGDAWRTMTAGRTWLHRVTEEHSYTERIGLSLLPRANGWAVISHVDDRTEHAGGGWKLFKTTDGGNGWSSVLRSLMGDIVVTDIDFDSGVRGWAAGCQPVVGEDSDGNTVGHNVALIARTSDGGVTWPTRLGPAELGITQPVSHLWAIEFKGPRGWAVGDVSASWIRSGLILRTIDGGATWTAKVLDGFWGIRRVSMATASVGWATAESEEWSERKDAGNRILRTTNGGRTWRIQRLPGRLQAIDVDAISATTAYAVGYRGDLSSGGMIAKTTDGGAHWVRVW
jgi:photosystem II stability/assembly factor-like uncharacterized protein